MAFRATNIIPEQGLREAKTLGLNGEQVERAFTAQQLSTTRSDLDAIAASIS